MTDTPHELVYQKGSALISSLSILLILTIIGVSAMSTSALQERMAGNARDADVAFEAAEAGLRAGENDVAALTSLNVFTTGGAQYFDSRKTTAADAWTDPNSWKTCKTTTYSGVVTVGSSPCYIIQLVDVTLGAPASASPEAVNYNTQTPAVQGSVKVFQVTAIGYGLSANSRVMLQSYYGRDGI